MTKSIHARGGSSLIEPGENVRVQLEVWSLWNAAFGREEVPDLKIKKEVAASWKGSRPSRQMIHGALT